MTRGRSPQQTGKGSGRTGAEGQESCDFNRVRQGNRNCLLENFSKEESVGVSFVQTASAVRGTELEPLKSGNSDAAVDGRRE